MDDTTMSGDFKMTRVSTGESLTIKMDGTELRDTVTPPTIEWCDTGQHYANRLGGNYTGEGYSQLWICLECARP
jgi:hypothetical protein